MINIKKCNRCLQELSISDFNFDKKKKDGYDNFCKSCKKEKIIIRYKNKEIITAKICNLCSLEKDVSKFTKAYNSKDGYFSQCKDCMKLRRREIIEENSKKNLVNINGTKVSVYPLSADFK